MKLSRLIVLLVMLLLVTTSYASRVHLKNVFWNPGGPALSVTSVSNDMITINTPYPIPENGLFIGFNACYTPGRGSVVTPVTINDPALMRAVRTISGPTNGGCIPGGLDLSKSYLAGLTSGVSRTITFNGPGEKEMLRFTLNPAPPAPKDRHVSRIVAPSVNPGNLVTFEVHLDYPVAAPDLPKIGTSRTALSRSKAGRLTRNTGGVTVEWRLATAACFSQESGQIGYSTTGVRRSGFNVVTIPPGDSFVRFTVRAKDTSQCTGRNHSIETFTNGRHATSGSEYKSARFMIRRPPRQ